MDRKSDVLLQVKDLSVQYPGKDGTVNAVSHAGFEVRRGEVLGIVGESGSGKSTVAYAMMRLLKQAGRVTGGSVIYEGRDILTFSDRDLQSLRGSEIGMIFQDPMQCLDPVSTIGAQLIETLRAHQNIEKEQARRQAVEMLVRVGLNEPEKLLKRYSFELSGGMQQRVMIAMALLCGPKLLIADEATTALDVTVQDQILQLLKKLRRERGMAMILITHNFGIVSEICDRVCVMYGGHVMEEGPVDEVFYRAANPYTKSLIAAIPKADPLHIERLLPIPGAPIDPYRPPSGCVFHPRCTQCMDCCKESVPPLAEVGEGHRARCHLLTAGKAKETEENSRKGACEVPEPAEDHIREGGA